MPYNSFDDYPMSWRPVLERRGRSVYLELVQKLEDAITCGELKPGTRLPPQRELADFLDLNVSTVAKAFKLCELKGLLTASVGSGTFVAYSALTDKHRTLPTAPAAIDMGTALPETSANAPLMEMARELFRSDSAEGFFSFQERAEDEWQKDAAVRLMELCGHRSHRDCILFANGGQNALSAILASLFRRGAKIAVDDHTYPGIKSAAAMFGTRLIPVRTTRDGMDPDDLERLCSREKIHGVYLISACHNPTTATLSAERREQIAATLRRHDVLLIEDGTYQLLQRGTRSVSDFIPDKSLYIATLSKVIAPGLRSAFVSVPQAYKDSVAGALYSLNVGVVPLMAELSARVIASGQFEQIVAEHKKQTAQRSATVRQLLPQAIGSDHLIYRWLPLPDGYDSVQFEHDALERGVRVFAAERFAIGKTPPAHAVRVSYCTPKTREDLERGLRVLAELTLAPPHR